MSANYNVCIVGIGAVGTEMIRLLRQSRLSRRERSPSWPAASAEETIDGEDYQVRAASPRGV